ncbi:MAG: hypothetical protein WDZ93_02475 [Candidatus Paceibacterota bacterium]
MTPTGLLGNELGKLGLPQDPREIIGQLLVFGDAENHIICGTITSIGYGPGEGVSFRVSSPKFHGHDIKKIVPSEDGVASLHAAPKLVVIGQFEIL